MNKFHTAIIAMAASTALVAGAASAAVTQTFGAGSAAASTNLAADFEWNTALSSNYSEGGLLFAYTGSSGNNGCGFAGVDCYDAPSDLGAGFAGNYMASAGSNAYISIRLADGKDFVALEMATSTGYLNFNGYWQTYNDGLLTGSGNFSKPAGVVLGLADARGFDEVRFFAFATANKTSGYSDPAIDSVRVLAVPEPSTWAMLVAGLLMLGGALRQRGRRPRG